MSNSQMPPPPPPSAPPPAPAAAPSYHPPQPQKTGLPTWAKALIGCGCLVLLIIAIGVGMLGWGATKVAEKYGADLKENPELAAAKIAIGLDPNLELVESGEGTMTIRDLRTGEEGTFDYSQIREGKISFEGAEGTYSIDGSGGEVKVTTPEGETRMETDADGGGMKITGPDGELTIGGGLDSVPSWVPRFDQAEWKSGGFITETSDAASGMIVASTTTSMEDLEAWYTEQLESEGYTLRRDSFSMNGQSQIHLRAEKEGIDSLIVTLGNDGEPGSENSISVAYSGPKNP